MMGLAKMKQTIQMEMIYRTCVDNVKKESLQTACVWARWQWVCVIIFGCSWKMWLITVTMVNQLEAAEGEKSEELLRGRSKQWTFILFKESVMLQLVSEFFIHRQKRNTERFSVVWVWSTDWKYHSISWISQTGRFTSLTLQQGGRWGVDDVGKSRLWKGECATMQCVVVGEERRRVWGECEGCREGERQGKGGRV